MLTREAILAARPAVLEPFEVPEWGGTIYIKAMNAGEFTQWQVAARDLNAESGSVAVSLLIATVTDDSGKPLFTADDMAALLAMPNTVVLRVYRAAAARNIVSEEDTRKNSQTRSAA